MRDGKLAPPVGRGLLIVRTFSWKFVYAQKWDLMSVWAESKDMLWLKYDINPSMNFMAKGQNLPLPNHALHPVETGMIYVRAFVIKRNAKV